MVHMKKNSKKLTNEQIDEIVTIESDDLSKWEEPIEVKAPQAILLRLSPELIQKIKFLATIHKTDNYQNWLEKIIKERIQLEGELLDSIKSDFTQS